MGCVLSAVREIGKEHRPGDYNCEALFVMIAYFQFASPEVLKVARDNPRMVEARADIPKLTDIKPTVMLGKSS